MRVLASSAKIPARRYFTRRLNAVTVRRRGRSARESQTEAARGRAALSALPFSPTYAEGTASRARAARDHLRRTALLPAPFRFDRPALENPLGANRWQGERTVPLPPDAAGGSGRARSGSRLAHGYGGHQRISRNAPDPAFGVRSQRGDLGECAAVGWI